MPRIETRLDRLRLVHRRREPRTAPTSFDPTRLTMKEQHELDGLLARFAPQPGAPWPLERMTDGELDRCYDLSRKAEGHEPSPAYVGMPHRDSGIGPCRCVDCERKPTPTEDDGRPQSGA